MEDGGEEKSENLGFWRSATSDLGTLRNLLKAKNIFMECTIWITNIDKTAITDRMARQNNRGVLK